jgi:hypothetical protein
METGMFTSSSVPRRAHPAVLASIVLLMVAGPVRAQTPAGSAFTYQGRLTDAGGAASGSFDIRFTLFDAVTGGAAVGTPVTVGAVAVSQGLFTVALDFGPAAFAAGQARWLQIEVRPAGGGGYTVLQPRQELTPTAYSVFSSRTDPANLTTLNASNLTSGTLPGPRLSGTYGQALTFPNAANAFTGTFSGNGSGLTALNASNLASGTVPGAVLAGAYGNPLAFPNPANVFTGDGSGLTNLNAQARYLRTVVVSPVGSAAENGAALLAALAGITTASPLAPWLLKIEPGTYDVGATSLILKPNVDVEGSGEGATKITGVGNPSNTVGTVHAVTGSELRFLTVESRGGAAFAKALFVNGASPRISHVTVNAFGGGTESQGFFVQGAATPVVRDLTANASATGSANSFAVLNISGATSSLTNVQANASGGAFARGVITAGGATPTLRNVVASAGGATTENLAVSTYDASPNLENVVAVASGPAVNNLGCLNFGAGTFTQMRGVDCRGYGGTGINYGCLNNGGAQPTIADLTAFAQGGSSAHGVENNGAGPGLSLSRVRVAASGASSDVAALLNVSSSPRIVELEAFANGSGTSTVYGVRVQSGTPSFSHVTVTAGGDSTGLLFGIAVSGVSTQATFTHGVVQASSAGGANVWGVDVTSAVATFTNVAASAAGGTSFNVGISTESGASTTLVGVTATGSGPTGSGAYGVTQFGASARLTNVTAQGMGATTTRIGLASFSPPSTVTVDRSTIAGATNSAVNSSGGTLTIAQSQLAGPVFNSGATTSCLMAYNGSYAALNAVCQ